MRRFRFHIGSLLILVVLLGVGFAALRQANDAWDSSILSVTMLILLVSIPLAIHRKAERRTFWAGFAIFGWSYFGLSAIPAIEYRLLTTRALVYVDSRIPRPASVSAQGRSSVGYTVVQDQIVTSFSPYSPQPVGSTAFAPGTYLLWDMTSGSYVWPGSTSTWYFIHIGHSLFALILAWIGGQLSRYLYLKDRGVEPPEAAPIPASG